MSRLPFTYYPYCTTPLAANTLEHRLRLVCPVCGYVYFADPKVAVIAQVGQDGRVLLVRRAVNPAPAMCSTPTPGKKWRFSLENGKAESLW